MALDPLASLNGRFAEYLDTDSSNLYAVDFEELLKTFYLHEK